MRLIDADALMDRLYDNEFAAFCPLDEVNDVIDLCPTVDAVPVIRCKDCDNRVYINMGDEIGVVGGCAIYEAALPEDFYCAYGKRGD